MSRSSSISRPGQGSRARGTQIVATNAWSVWLTHAAILIVIAIVVSRLLISEQLRSPGGTTSDSPISPGPPTTLLLDFLAVIPAMLVLARRCIDPSFKLRAAWVAAPALLLGAWAVLSATWSADRFAAVVGSITFCSAMLLMWASIQVVGTWFRFRIVAGTCVGLLVILTLTGYWYRFSDWPDLKAQWAKDRDQILHAHDWKPNSFEANQFEKRILSGQVMGFSTSPNTYAALLVLLGTVTAGAAVQQLASPRQTGRLLLLSLLIVSALPILWWTGCRAAAITTAGAVLALSLRASVGPPAPRRARKFFVGGVVAILFGAGCVVFLGVSRGTLLHSSLTFRWWYWVASARMFVAHPLLGVGWDNFGPHYLGVRLPIASEEIRDPHNFIVRFAAELGSMGLLLLFAWMGRLWWDLTTRATASSIDSETQCGASTFRTIALIILLAAASLGLSAIVGIDFVTSPAFAMVEVVKRMIFALLLAAGIATALVQVKAIAGSSKGGLSREIAMTPDSRPAPWMLFAVIVGLGFFLVHSLIDFAFFETGPMYLFALLSGAALSMRQAHSADEEVSEPRSIVPFASLIALIAVWLTGLLMIAIPIGRAEQDAREADEVLRTLQNAGVSGASQLEAARVASEKLASAARRVPYNSDYAVRAAVPLVGSSDPADRNQAGRLLDTAVASDPTSIGALLTRAQFQLAQKPPAMSLARADFERALALDPNNVHLRLRFVDLLVAEGDREAARRQIESALRANNGLTRDEVKRLSADDVRSYEEMAQRLR